MLVAKDLRFSYDQREYIEFPDLSCSSGDQLLILGESGSGKTTLLHLLAGLRKAKEGHVEIAGKDLSRLSGAAMDKFRGKSIGIIFQQAHFVRALNIRDNLKLAQDLAGMPIDTNRIQEVLERLGIAHKADSKPHQLSIGEQQRASICRALINNPTILLADEPTSALDDHHCGQVIKLIKEQAAKDHITLLIVTHDNRLKQEFEHYVQLEKPEA